MRKLYKAFSLLALMTGFVSLANAQNNFFTDAGQNRTMSTTGNRVIIPDAFRTSSLNVNAMKDFLWSLPSENNFINNRSAAPVISLPMPDGSTARFRVWESSIQEPGLAAKFPEIKTFAGQGIDDPYATIRFDYNPYFGFSAQILSPNGRIYIDPYARMDVNNYISYYQRDNNRRSPFKCDVVDEPIDVSQHRTTAGPCLGTSLRTYRLAVACTGEYAQAVGGGVAGPTHAAIVTTTNRVNGVYEVELAVRLVLIANNNLIEYLNGATDPFVNTINTALLNANQANTDAVIGSANYDIGHVFTSDDNGLAQLNAVCGSGKARGATGAPVLVGDGFDIDYVAHEMGHQFGANHTFNTHTCFGGAAAGGSYEPGGGTTIMAYAGICGSTENLQPNSDPIFHAFSFDQISTYITSGGGSGCAVVTATGNTLPVITSTTANNLSIPINTPFVLDATATDANGDAITYNWEGWDIGPADTWPSAANSTTRPLFRTRVSKTTGQRTFPDIRVIAANYPGTAAPSAMNGLRGEVLPAVARTMKFRLTVRDNRAGGGGVVSSGEGCQGAATFQVNAVGTTPFAVTSPNGGESYAGGTTQTITWNNAGTTAAPFNVANVRITLSTDGGLTYPIEITPSTANDGSEALTIPSVATTTARIRIEAIGNIFFDISNANFTITAPVNGFTFNSPAAVTATCPATTMTSGNLTATYTGTYTGNINLSTSVTPALPVGAAIVLSNPVLTTATPSTTVSLTGMGAALPGSYTVSVTGTGVSSPFPVQTANITFTINPGAGPAITANPANQSVCVGANTSFSITSATATGFQWQVNTGSGFTNITNGAPYSGATTNTLTITGVTAAMNTYQYRALATAGCGSSTSNAATLTVNVAPAITTNPASQAVCSGSAVTFNSAATGSGISYQWQDSPDGVTFTNIPTATSQNYTIASTTLSQNNYRYRVVVTGTCSPAATSTAATLTVSSSITITGNPSNQTVCEGTNTSFTVAASGTGLSYQWEVSTNGGGTWANVTNGGVYGGATTPTLTLTNVPPSFNTYRYRAIVSNPSCTPGTSTAAILTVNTFPVINAQPANLAICEGANTSFTVGATTAVGSLTYQWQFSADGGTTWTNIPGATSATYAQTGVPAGQNGYRFRVIVSAGCGSVTSSVTTLTVNRYPVVTFAPVSEVCASDEAFALTATPAGGTFAGTGVSGSTFTPSASIIGVSNVTYTATNAGCVTTVSRSIAVNDCAERHLRLSEFPATVVYPVPNSGNFNIRLNTDLYTKVGIRIFNANGQLVKSQDASGLRYGSVIPVSITNVATGVYQVYMYSDEQGGSSKSVSILIQR
mgnify:CR=1 FL=1